jgi:hypothetical protein
VASVEVRAGREQRRRWRSEQKQAIVAQRLRLALGARRGAAGRRDIEFDLP